MLLKTGKNTSPTFKLKNKINFNFKCAFTFSKTLLIRKLTYLEESKSQKVSTRDTVDIL